MKSLKKILKKRKNTRILTQVQNAHKVHKHQTNKALSPQQQTQIWKI